MGLNVLMWNQNSIYGKNSNFMNTRVQNTYHLSFDQFVGVRCLDTDEHGGISSRHRRNESLPKTLKYIK